MRIPLLEGQETHHKISPPPLYLGGIWSIFQKSPNEILEYL